MVVLKQTEMETLNIHGEKRVFELIMELVLA